MRTNDRSYLASSETPSSLTEQHAREQRLEDQLFLFPGRSVRLLVDLSGLKIAQRNEVAEATLRDCLQMRGIRVVGELENADVTLRVSAKQNRETRLAGVLQIGRSLRFLLFASSREPVLQFDLSRGGGKSEWEHRFPLRKRGWLKTAEGEEDEELTSQMEADLRWTFYAGRGSHGLPTYLFRSLHDTVWGESYLLLNEERERKPGELETIAAVQRIRSND